MRTKEENKETAATILKQLGGNRFVVMTGAKQLAFIENGLQFKIGRNLSKANIVTIEVNGLDLYDMTFRSLRGTKLAVKREMKNLYAEDLAISFEEATGLYTRL